MNKKLVWRFAKVKLALLLLAGLALALHQGCSSTSSTESATADADALTVPSDPPPAATDNTADAGGEKTEEKSADPAAQTASSDAAPGPAVSHWDPKAAVLDLKREPFQVDGTWMNAYYFTRSPKENWKTISQKLYGTQEHAADLKKWNAGQKLRTGEVVYYNSPSRPTDSSAMKICAEDFGIPLEQVEVKAGDSISKLAKKLFGNVRDWKEIAAANPDIQPNRLVAGTILKVQPTSKDSRGPPKDMEKPSEPALETAQAGLQEPPAQDRAPSSEPPMGAPAAAPNGVNPGLPMAGATQAPPQAPIAAAPPVPPPAAPEAPKPPVIASKPPQADMSAHNDAEGRDPASAGQDYGSLVAKLMANPMALGAIGLGVLGMVGFTVMQFRRRKAASEIQE